MRHVAILGVGIALTGCSLIYSPSNLPAPVDAQPIDADPSMLMVDSAGPAVLFEGQGVDGSRPAILAITGNNFIAPVTVRVFATGSETPMITVNNDPMISSTNDVLAVSLTLPIDTVIASADIPLTIEVSQPGGAGVVTKSLLGAVALRTLPELDKAITDSMALKPLYSRVNIPAPAGLTFTAASGKPRALIRSMSTINLGAVNVSAEANAAGPGGQAGGAANTVGGGGSSGGRAGNAVAGGGGGGFTTAGMDGSGLLTTIAGGISNGDPLISNYDTNISAGGGGGGSVGGGGGGTLELTAAGDVYVGAITANGGAGTDGGLTAGGGGAGGIVVIRSGGTAMLNGAIDVLAGAAGKGGAGTAGAGSIGRTRIDAPQITGTPAVNPPFHIGASFDPATPLTTKTSPFGIKLFGTVADKFDVVVLDAAGGTSSPAFTADFGNATTITVKPALQPGFNRVCVTQNGGSVTVAEATNCIDLAYLP